MDLLSTNGSPLPNLGAFPLPEGAPASEAFPPPEGAVNTFGTLFDGLQRPQTGVSGLIDPPLQTIRGAVPLSTNSPTPGAADFSTNPLLADSAGRRPSAGIVSRPTRPGPEQAGNTVPTEDRLRPALAWQLRSIESLSSDTADVASSASQTDEAASRSDSDRNETATPILLPFLPLDAIVRRVISDTPAWTGEPVSSRAGAVDAADPNQRGIPGVGNSPSGVSQMPTGRNSPLFPPAFPPDSDRSPRDVARHAASETSAMPRGAEARPPSPLATPTSNLNGPDMAVRTSANKTPSESFWSLESLVRRMSTDPSSGVAGSGPFPGSPATETPLAEPAFNLLTGTEEVERFKAAVANFEPDQTPRDGTVLPQQLQFRGTANRETAAPHASTGLTMSNGTSNEPTAAPASQPTEPTPNAGEVPSADARVAGIATDNPIVIIRAESPGTLALEQPVAERLRPDALATAIHPSQDPSRAAAAASQRQAASAGAPAAQSLPAALFAMGALPAELNAGRASDIADAHSSDSADQPTSSAVDPPAGAIPTTTAQSVASAPIASTPAAIPALADQLIHSALAKARLVEHFPGIVYELRVAPEELGPLKVELRRSGNKLSLHVSVHSAETHELLLAARETIESALAQSHATAELTLDISTGDFGRDLTSQQQGFGERPERLEIALDPDEPSDNRPGSRTSLGILA